MRRKNEILIIETKGKAPDRVEGRHIATQNRLHILVQQKTRPNQPG